MQRIISNNDMNNPREGLPVLDSITSKLLNKAFEVLRPRDAIAISGSSVVALTLQNHGLSSFLPGDIDVFVKQDLKLEDQVFDRHFLHWHILAPLLAQGIHWEPKEIPIRNGLPSNVKKYRAMTIDVLHIIEIGLFQDGKDVAANRPKIQIIIVADDTPVPQELSSLSLTPFERNVVTSFDIDIVQGAYNPNTGRVTFAHPDTQQNILRMKFWYICDSRRSFRLSSVIKRIKKYTDRKFHFIGFRDIIHEQVAISLGQFTMSELLPFEPDTDPQEALEL
jgi:hypothetical protein